MIKEREIAILFSRKNMDNGLKEFIPIDIIEGIYSEDDGWFVDLNNNVYPHICQSIAVGNVYGARISVLKNLQSAEKMSLEQMKTIALKFAKRYIYIQDEYEERVIIINKLNNKISVFADKDTIDSDFEEMEECNNQSNNILSNYKLTLNPQCIYDKLKKKIIGQDESIKKISTAIYLNCNYSDIKKQNMLVVGPTGVGKTFIFEELSKQLDIPLTIYSVPGLSQAGYVGKDTNDIIRQVLVNCKYDVSRAEHSIVILDEIDKIANLGENSGSISTEGVQNELLKLIEGEKVTINMGELTGQTYIVDTSKITFVGLGAFQEIYNTKSKNNIGFGEIIQTEPDNKISVDRMVKFGLKRELIGRLPVLVELNNLTKEDLKNILKNPNSEFQKMLSIINDLGISCSNIEDLYDIIADNSVNKHIGARGIITTINNIFINIFYQILSNPQNYQELIIGNNILNDNNDYVLKMKDLTQVSKKRVLSSKGN